MVFVRFAQKTPPEFVIKKTLTKAVQSVSIIPLRQVFVYTKKNICSPMFCSTFSKGMFNLDNSAIGILATIKETPQRNQPPGHFNL